MVDGIRVALAPQGCRVGAEREPPVGRVDLDPAGMVELALAEHQVTEHQEPAGLAFDRDAPLHRRVVARGDRRHGDRCARRDGRSSGNR